MAKETAVEQIRLLQEQMDTLKKKRHDELVAEIETRIEELATLGFDYSFGKGGKPKKGGRPAGTKLSEEARAKMSKAAKDRWEKEKG